jgi:hypothetical protein
LDQLVVGLALDTHPFLRQSAAGQSECKYAGWLGGFPDQIHRTGASSVPAARSHAGPNETMPQAMTATPNLRK